MPSQINAVKNEKVDNLNRMFTEVQRDVKSVSKSVAPEPKKPAQVEEDIVNIHIFFLHLTFEFCLITTDKACVWSIRLPESHQRNQ